jgi:hypothetical protein
MPTNAELVSWARTHATRLEADMTLHPKEPGFAGPYWEATDLAAESRIRARAITTLDFLHRFAGPESQWSVRGHAVFDKGSRSMETGARDLGDVLRAWADQVESGILVVPQVEASGVRAIASTDLMEQVRKLLDDKGVHPAAPIVLAGAALEIALRSAVDQLNLQHPERPSISAYAAVLRTAGLLSAQDIKDVTAMGGMRNSAAHGEFADLTRAHATLTEQQVNIFLRRLADLLAPKAFGAEAGSPEIVTL